jgi:hypothetical protein
LLAAREEAQHLFANLGDKYFGVATAHPGLAD